MNRKIENEVVLAVFNVTERVLNRKIGTRERTQFKGLLSSSEGEEMEFVDSSCLKKKISARRWGDGLDFRLALSPEAAMNGCVEKAKQWAEECNRAVDRIYAGTGQNRDRNQIRFIIVIDRGRIPELIFKLP